MKNTFIAILFGVPTFLFSQVKLGASTGNISLSSPGVSLEFSTEENKGIILPYVTNAAAVDANAAALGSSATVAESGTIIYDKEDRKVKIKDNNGWKDLTAREDGTVNDSFQKDFTESAQAKTSIGTTSNINGILVLEDKNKAMILPTVTSTDQIIDPSIGMMVFVNNGTNKLLATFNGTQWSFWTTD